MNKTILFGIIMYYALVSMFFFAADSAGITGGYNGTAVNLSALDQSEETESGGLFSAGVSFARWWLFMNFGIGLGSDAPSWFAWVWVIWQTCFSIFVIAFIISSIWNG